MAELIKLGSLDSEKWLGIPVSSEISDLCEISDLLLFFTYFASQNKESLTITFLMCVV